MPPRGDRTAPTFDPTKPRELKRFFSELQYHFDAANVTDDTEKKKQSVYESVTAFWALWCGCATDEQAAKLVKKGIQKFEVAGGLVSGTEESRGPIGLDRPNRQWE